MTPQNSAYNPHDDFPIEFDVFLSTIASLLIDTGHSLEATVLASSAARLQRSTDNYDGYLFEIFLEVPQSIFLTVFQRREAVRDVLTQCAVGLLEPYSYHDFDKFNFVPEVNGDPDWRAKTLAAARGDGVSNQGRVRSSNIATREHDGLLFRSQQEVNLYRALKSLGIVFAPLPVFLRGGKTYSRLEPDFIIVRNGITMMVEVDGDTFHTESPTKAHERAKVLLDEGVYLERIAAEQCGDEAKARNCAAKLIGTLDRISKR